MVPRSLQRQLNRLRRRERLLRVTWAAARCLTVFSVVLAAACLIDFVVDLYRDTPRWLRLGLLGVQAALWLAGAAFVLRFLMQRFHDAEVALWIEDRMPQLGHRLISAVQLNRPGAATAGMSPEMIAAVTRQAEDQAAAADFAQIADTWRLKWTAQLLAPPVLAVLILLVFWPDTLKALLARQFLDDRPIPRALAIASVRAHQVWPAGEEGVLRFRVRGAFAEHLRGEVRLDLPDGDKERHELIFESQDESGATFLARVPPLARDFTYRAWLKDGRTHEAAEVHFEPRPLVRRQQAWMQLPSSIGVKASGKPYEEAQKGADIVYRLAGSTARVAIETQKPIAKATVEVLGPPSGGQASSLPAGGKPTPRRLEVVRRSVELEVRGDGCTAEGVFAFDPGRRGESMQPETAYRIVVRDAFGLENNDKPRRGIRTAPVDPPEVALLPETLSPRNAPPTEDDEIEGIPILLGQRVPIAYECKAMYGLSHARLRYRVIPHTASRDEEGEASDSEFLPLPLGAPRGQPGKPSQKALEEFFAPPSDDPDTLGGIKGGGRYDFDSAGIPDGKGGLLKLQEGDRIQFYVEVFGRADPDGVPGRSAIREKEIVNQKDFWAWIEKKEDHKERIRQLEEQQRGIAGVVSLLPEERPRFSPQRENALDRAGRLDQTIGDQFRAMQEQPGRGWQLIGPFPNDKDAGHVHAYPPEMDKTDLDKEYDGLNGKVRWQEYHSPTDKIDLQKIFHHGDAGVAYAACWVKPAGRLNATLATGSDDGIKVWINRKLVLDKAVHREAIPADDKTPITLEDAWQEILVKIDNRFGSWAFYLDLLDSSGKPLPRGRVQVRTAPASPYQGKGFVKDWLMLGPFLDKDGKGHAKVFPPEHDPVDLKRDYDSRNGKARWKPYHGKENIIGLNDVFSLKPENANGAVAYAVCWVKSDKDRLAILATGSDDGIKAWINRQLVLDKAAQRATEPSSERTPVRLKAGWNELLVKIDNGFGWWSFCLELLDPPSGKALPNVQYQITPPEKKR
jgi:hypothetical protein